jgi:site-specific DNA-methyltransferase (adenine-specific)
MSNVKMFKYEWIWNKDKAGNIMCSGYQPMKVHENICVFSKSKTIFNKQMTEAIKENIRPSGKEYKNRESIIGIYNWKHSEKRDNTKRNPKSIINISSVSAECNNVNRVHPTQKPVALFEYLIKTYTNEGDLVLDNCAGSGTTGVACKNLNRNFILIEKEQEYIDIINKRLTAV